MSATLEFLLNAVLLLLSESKMLLENIEGPVASEFALFLWGDRFAELRVGGGAGAWRSGRICWDINEG